MRSEGIPRLLIRFERADGSAVEPGPILSFEPIDHPDPETGCLAIGSIRMESRDRGHAASFLVGATIRISARVITTVMVEDGPPDYDFGAMRVALNYPVFKGGGELPIFRIVFEPAPPEPEPDPPARPRIRTRESFVKGYPVYVARIDGGPDVSSDDEIAESGSTPAEAVGNLLRHHADKLGIDFP